jgi:hypothetical protein
LFATIDIYILKDKFWTPFSSGFICPSGPFSHLAVEVFPKKATGTKRSKNSMMRNLGAT